MSTPSADADPHDDSSSPNSEEPLRPGFHERDPAAIAEEAALGQDGPLWVERAQDLYRQIFELVEDEAWPDAPTGPLGDQWRGVVGLSPPTTS